MNAVAPGTVPGGAHGAVPVPELREADPGGVQGPGQEPADPAGRGGAGPGLAAVQAPDQQQAHRQGRPAGPVPDAEEGLPRPQRQRGHGRQRQRRRREGASPAEPAEDAEPGGGAGAGVQGDEGPDVQDGQGQQQVLGRRSSLLPPDRRQGPAEALLN